MSSKQEMRRDRIKRLQAFFQSNPQEWDDLKEEIQQCLLNAMTSLKSKDCDDRSFYAGKCMMAEEVMNIEGQYKR